MASNRRMHRGASGSAVPNLGGGASSGNIARGPAVEELDEIDIMNALQNKLAASGLDIKLPQIAVIGGQSAGKSSVLERIVGKEFLPRGTNLITRRPTIIQLIPYDDEYGVFLHKKNEQFRDFAAIRDEIQRVTDEECEPNGVSKKPIYLRIYSPTVPKLTFIDLPGIVKVPVNGQKNEIVSNVEDIVFDHIKNKETLILAITPMSTSDSVVISLAMETSKKVDPEGERTIGVLTKIENKAVDARNILDNKILHLKNGWVGVVNRDQTEIDEGKDMDYITKKEADFFQNSELYRDMAHRMGISCLKKLLQEKLRSHIEKNLPKVRNDITTKLSRFQKELKELESVFGEGPNTKQVYMVRLIQKFSDDFNVKVMGYSQLVPTNTVTAGAIMNFKLQTEVQKIISQVAPLNEDEINNVIVNQNALRNSVSVPSLAVDTVCGKLIDRFRTPLDSAVMYMRDLLIDAVADSAKLLDICPSLKYEVMHQINQWIDKESENTKDRLNFHIETEMFFINIFHPSFDSATFESLAPTAGPIKIGEDLDSKKTGDGDTLSKLLSANELMQKRAKYVSAVAVKYLEIVKVQISDSTIKYIAYSLVKKVVDTIREELIPTVLTADNFSSVTEDCDNEIRKRDEIANNCNVLKDALDAIQAFMSLKAAGSHKNY